MYDMRALGLKNAPTPGLLVSVCLYSMYVPECEQVQFLLMVGVGYDWSGACRSVTLVPARRQGLHRSVPLNVESPQQHAASRPWEGGRDVGDMGAEMEMEMEMEMAAEGKSPEEN